VAFSNQIFIKQISFGFKEYACIFSLSWVQKQDSSQTTSDWGLV